MTRIEDASFWLLGAKFWPLGTDEVSDGAKDRGKLSWALDKVSRRRCTTRRFQDWRSSNWRRQGRDVDVSCRGFVMSHSKEVRAHLGAPKENQISREGWAQSGQARAS